MGPQDPIAELPAAQQPLMVYLAPEAQEGLQRKLVALVVAVFVQVPDRATLLFIVRS